MHAYRPASIQLCDVGIAWLNNVHGSLRGDVRPTGMDVTLLPNPFEHDEDCFVGLPVLPVVEGCESSVFGDEKRRSLRATH
jgi:hypothetical protein